MIADAAGEISWARCTLFWDRFGSFTLAILATVVITQVIFNARAEAEKRRTLPPGPRPWPILGNLPVMSSLPHRSLQQVASKFGGIMYLRLGCVPCIVVSTAEAARAIFKTNDASFSARPKGLSIEAMTDNYKTMVFAPYGPYWRHIRKFCSTELFSPKRHASYGNSREEELREGMKELGEDCQNGKPINLKRLLLGVNSNIMTRMLINKRYFGKGENEQAKQEYMQFMERSFALSAALIIADYVPCLSFITKLQGLPSKFKDHREEAQRLGGKMLEVEKHRQRAKERGPDENYTPDFVDMISEAPLAEDGKPFPDRLLTLIIVELLQAGTETTATTVEWAMSELMLNPEVMKRAQEELDAVVGPHRLVQESDIPNLPYFQAIVKETFRMHPPAPLSIPRESTEDTQVMGYKIPAGTRLFLNIFAIHRDPAVYENPDVFNPERFIEHPEVNHLAGFDSFELSPFGLGRRMCPGYVLGNTMVHLMLSNLLHSYNWTFLKGQSLDTLDMAEAFGIAVGKKNPLELIATPRAHVASH